MTSSTSFFCIRGYMKSGTNWICRLLKTHPDIDCVGEFHWESFFHALDDNMAGIAPNRRAMLNDCVRPELESMIRRCLATLAEDVKWIGDRTPTTIAPVILPRAPHIVVVRDFRDVIVSRMFHLYNHPRVTSIFDNFPEMKTRLAAFQNDPWYFREQPDQLLANEEVVRDSARDWLAHQHSDRQTVASYPDLPVKYVRYEDLHSDFDDQVASLFQFLKTELPKSIPTRLQPGHDTESPNQLNRKGQVGDWKNYMTNSVREWINEEAGDELIRQGYVESLDW